MRLASPAYSYSPINGRPVTSGHRGTDCPRCHLITAPSAMLRTNGIMEKPRQQRASAAAGPNASRVMPSPGWVPCCAFSEAPEKLPFSHRSVPNTQGPGLCRAPLLGLQRSSPGSLQRARLCSRMVQLWLPAPLAVHPAHGSFRASVSASMKWG